jgi:predicted RNase H-like HicB family nuclease
VVNYVGIMDGSGGAWGVRIPDVPGCHGGGATAEAALADAIGALRETAAHYLAHDIAVPRARGMAEIIQDKSAEFDPAKESLVIVPLLLDRGRPVKANISLDAGLLEAIDAAADRRGLTRSGFLASAALDKIEREVKGGDGRRARDVKGRTQIKDPLTGTWAKRDTASGRVLDPTWDAKRSVRTSKAKSR